ncbi:MAG: cytochrome b/b6 domain-containing protein [Parasphingorhabdus sp.]|uniref:cytochrome b/b6 domain-containing protein n=1 Tax=Parasphingorhabdus sp. TaxID=2709688 RepID=UPI003297E4F0
MNDGQAQTRIWDWTVRLFHWLIVLIVPALWWTADQGLMDWHKRLGLTMFALLLFRLTWGVVGTWTARFLPMLRQLLSLPSYLKNLVAGNHEPSFGHSPLGTLSVIALLGLLSVQVTTGLFSVDVDGLESGPLATLVAFKTGRELADIHELNFDLLVIFIALHISAIAVYRWLFKNDLIRPMVTGMRSDIQAPTTIVVHVWELAIGIAVALAGVYGVTRLG